MNPMRQIPLIFPICMMRMANCVHRILLVALLILGIPEGDALSAAFNDSGPGTGGISIPQVFTPNDFSSVRHQVRPATLTISPPIQRVLGISPDPEGGFPNDPIEYDLVVTTTDSVDVPWLPGETHLLLLLARSSSSRFVRTPPRIDLLLVGPSPGIWREGPPLAVNEDPVEWVVPSVPPGLYRFHAFDSSTGLSKTSDFTFEIGSLPVELTPTPTPTITETQTPTPTETPVIVLPTETPTPTEPSLAVYDWSDR
jgi:hypothetical protein